MFLTIAKDINEKSYLLDCRGIEKNIYKSFFFQIKKIFSQTANFYQKKKLLTIKFIIFAKQKKQKSC